MQVIETGHAIRTRIRKAALLCVLLPALAGCGMQAVDNQVTTRSAAGIDEMGLEVSKEFLCPAVVPVDNQQFEVKALKDIPDSGALLGTFVPCNTPVPAGAGQCPNAACGQRFTTTGAPAAPPTGPKIHNKNVPIGGIGVKAQNEYSRDVVVIKPPTGNGGHRYSAPASDTPYSAQSSAVKAVPQLQCPNPKCKKSIPPGDALLHGKPPRIAQGKSVCPFCKTYFSSLGEDKVIAVHNHGELICPSCKKAVDPDLNKCENGSCKLKTSTGGILYRGRGIMAPCWRCGGGATCPNCYGSGDGSSGIYDVVGPGKDDKPTNTTPKECWYCGGSGMCPECDGSLVQPRAKIGARPFEHEGFVEQFGTLPPGYTHQKREGEGYKAVPNKKRKWKHSGAEAKGKDAKAPKGKK